MAKERVLEEVVADFCSLSLEEYAMCYHHIVVMLTLVHAAGWTDMDYPTLAVESGVGLSFGYKRNHCIAMYGLQGGAPERIAHTTGCQLEWSAAEDLEQAWTWVVETIDRGQPVGADYWEWHIIAGYREGKKPEDRGWFVLANEPVTDWNGAWLTWEQIKSLGQDCPWSKHRCRYAGRVPQWTPSETARHVIEWIVTWSERHPAADKEAYKGSLFGFGAIAAYAADLADLSKTLEEDFGFGNNACHAITPQWNTRRYIGTYLADRADLFEGAAREKVQEAAARYYDAYEAWVVFDELLGQRFVHQHGGEQKEGWADPARRAKGSDAVYAALEHEKAAVAALRAALTNGAGSTAPVGRIASE
jgi:hypothetical protein